MTGTGVISTVIIGPEGAVTIESACFTKRKETDE